MKKAFLIILLPFLTSFILFAPETAPDYTYIKFGEQGGFTGAATEFTLLKNGILAKMLPNDKVDMVQTLLKKEMKYIRYKLKGMKKKYPNFYKPGNMTRHIIYHNKKTGVNVSWTWGEAGFMTPEEVTSFYDYLMNFK